MKNTFKSLRRFGIDLLGVTFIILTPLLGWLPGPGGTIIFFAGLRLLAINHSWAERFQRRVFEKSVKYAKKIFSQHPLVRGVHDFLSAILIFIGIYLINTYTRNFTLTFAIFCISMGLALFLGNRERLDKLVKKAKKTSLE